MKKINTLLLALLSVVALTWTSCSDEVEYTPAGAVEGAGVYFPSSVVTSYELEGTSGNIMLDVMRTDSIGAIDAKLTATFTEGGESLFTVPSSVGFADGSNVSSMTISYNNLVQGTNYEVTLTFEEGTPYANSSITLSFLYPNKIEYTWEVVSENAIYTDNIFSMYGGSNITLTGLTVEKAQGYNMYRFKSPYDNAYMEDNWGIAGFFPEDFEFPYIVLDGETYEGKWYIAPTALEFKMTDGVGPSVDTSWNTFGSVAGNLQTSAGPIGPDNANYPLGTYNAQSKVFDFGATYHNLDGYGYYVIGAGAFTLALDPALLEPDYDRDYTWADVPDATGFFTSELLGESWMQAVQQSEEDSTFYRMPNLYSNVEKAHIYFHLNEDGTVTIPDAQNTGLTTFGNPVRLEGTNNASSYDAVTQTLTLGFTFYLADEEGNKLADLQEVKETFLWGQSEFEQLQKNTSIDAFVGTWNVMFTDGADAQLIPVTVSKLDASTLRVTGLSGGIDGYDDSMLLAYDAETGWVNFSFQEVNPIDGYRGFVSPFDSKTSGFDMESLIGGLTKNGNLKFLNNETNEGRYDAMIYLISDGQAFGTMTGYWSSLEWTKGSASQSRSFSNFNVFDNLKVISNDVTPRRIYRTELNMKPKANQNTVKCHAKGTLSAPSTDFSVIR